MKQPSLKFARPRDDYQRRHNDAIDFPTPQEAPIVEFLKSLVGVADHAGRDGFGGPHVLMPILHGASDMLNFERYRLDGGRCSSYLHDVARYAGWSLDTEQRLLKYSVSYEIRSHMDGGKKAVRADTVVVEATNKTEAEQAASTWVGNNDPYFDDRIEPKVIIVGVRQVRED